MLLLFVFTSFLGYPQYWQEYRRQKHRQSHCHVACQLHDAGPPEVGVREPLPPILCSLTQTQLTQFTTVPHNGNGYYKNGKKIGFTLPCQTLCVCCRCRLHSYASVIRKAVLASMDDEHVSCFCPLSLVVSQEI